MAAHLFIGGAHDGQVREVAYEPMTLALNASTPQLVTSFDRDAPAAQTTVELHTYCRTTFSTPERKVTLYAHEKLSAADVLDALVRNYGGADSQRLRGLLKLVQSDPGNWLHSDLQEAIVAEVGEDPPYRSIDDSGLAPAELKPPAD